MKFIACDAVVGLPRVPFENGVRPDTVDLLSEMDRLRISAALVRHRACIENEPYWGNRTLLEESAGRERLLPVWALTPDGESPAFNAAATVHAMLAAGVRVAWLSPSKHGYSASPWCSGELCAALETAQTPVLVSYDEIDGDHLNGICTAFPRLRIVLLRVPRLGRNRLLYPLLRRHVDLYVCFDACFSVFEGYRDLCRTFGSHRWVLGTGYPDAEGGAAMTGLMYAGLTDAQVEAVAHANVERLLQEVRLDV